MVDAKAVTDQMGNLSARERRRILFAVMFGIIMTPIDASKVNIILPALTEVFAADMATAQWIPMIYLLIISSLVLFFGRVGDIWGYKKVFLLGLVVFTIASALCGIAPGIGWLIFFRAVQGVGAAMLMAVPLAMITACFPLSELGWALGTYSVSVSAGLAIGPTFGGFIAGWWGWRSTFFVNVPIGIAAFIVARRIIPELKGEQGRFDLVGASLAFAFMFCLFIFFNRAQVSGLTPINGALLAVSIIGCCVFFLTERNVGQPMLDLVLFKNVTFAFGSVSALLNYMAQYVVIFLIPFHLHRVLQFSPVKIGVMMSFFPVAVMVVGPLSGWLADRVGSRSLSFIGSAICGLSIIFLALLKPSSGEIFVALGLVMFGIGTGIFQSPNARACMLGVPRPHLGIASAILSEMRNVGMVAGITLAGVVLHFVVSDEVLEKHFLTSLEADQFFRGIQQALIAGAGVAFLGAMTSLVKRQEKQPEQTNI